MVIRRFCGSCIMSDGDCPDGEDELEVLEVLRQEKKYLLYLEQTERMRVRLKQALQEDVHGREHGGYLVRSLYFDTPDDTDFHEKSDGVGDRKKIRLRIYDPESDSAKLELKEKWGDFQRKRSLSVSREEAKRIMDGDYSCLLLREEDFALEMYIGMQKNCYRPRCIVEYDRAAWFVRENDIRVTLDSNIRATESNLDLFSEQLMSYPVSERGMTTLEVKFNHFMLSYVRELLSLHGEPQVSASKYCMARRIGMRGTE